MSAELLPCPFCGGPADMRQRSEYPSFWGVRCRFCGARGPERSTSDLARDAWELREPKPRVPASVE